MTALTVEQIAEVLARHQCVAMGMTYQSPDRCRCGVETLPQPGDEDVSIRRDRAFATHQAEQVAALGVGDGEVEWGVRADISPGRPPTPTSSRDEALFIASTVDYATAVQRYVPRPGPWVEVTDEGGHCAACSGSVSGTGCCRTATVGYPQSTGETMAATRGTTRPGLVGVR